MSNSDDFRKMMTLLESIEQGNRSQQLDEIFGIPPILPDWVPGSEANKEKKHKEYVERQKEYNRRMMAQKEELFQQYGGVARALLAESNRTPVWIYLPYNASPDRDQYYNILKTAADDLHFKLVVLILKRVHDSHQYPENIAVTDDDAPEGSDYGSAEVLLQMCHFRHWPQSCLFWKGKPYLFENSGGNPRDTEDGNTELSSNKDTANTVEKVKDIMRRYCNWPPTNSPSDNVVPFRNR